MILVAVLIVSIYTLIIFSFVIGFDALETFDLKKIAPKNKFSIIIPFRNEAKNLEELLNTIKRLSYPSDRFEVLFVDDHSRDKSESIIKTFQNENAHLNIYVLKNSHVKGSPKKNAIKIAIKNSKFDWIVTTDADCEVPENWLQLFNDFIEEKECLFIAAPVKYKIEFSLLQQLQQINLASLIASTIGSFGIDKPILCNGANLCYSKTAFYEVNGFEGNTKISSGDDVFLLEKIAKRYPKKALFLKSKIATVITKPEATIKDFFNQQLRWAAKSGHYKNRFTQFVGISVLLINLLVVSAFVGLIFNYAVFGPIFLGSLVIKMAVDAILMFKVDEYFSMNFTGLLYLVSSITYPFFVMFIGIASFFVNYSWKGRAFKK